MVKKIITFTDLNTWKEGHKLVILIYQTTSKFPVKETYSLIDQMRRASVSVTSNLAEGFSRQGIKEKIQFYLMAKGSLTELQNQLHVAKDIGYLKEVYFNDLMNQAIIVHKLITGLIKGVKKFSIKHSS